MGLQPGECFGRYELVSRLGHGGMAETWRARLLGAAGVTKPVLIKRILPEYATDEAFTSMFISEARISCTLSHGNIAQVYDFGEVDGEYFLAMEYVEGQPLHRLIKRALRSGFAALPMPLATFIAIEMCRGLHYAHTRTSDTGKPLGIVHRDISPDNVLVSYEGQVKLVDFGIAKARALRNFNTAPGVVKGKYLFFSPEQARGEEVDGRTDVWATGVVLYELLCGRLPVEGPEYVAIPKLINGAFPRPSVLRPDLPVELDNLVMRALALKRDGRFESSHAFGDALTGFLYASTPRFSAMSLSHFIQELFREELSKEGRAVQVPATFLEELDRWRIPQTSPMGQVAVPQQLPSAETEPAVAGSFGPTRVPFLRRHSRKTKLLIGAIAAAGVALAMATPGFDKQVSARLRAWLKPSSATAGPGAPGEVTITNPPPTQPGTLREPAPSPQGGEEKIARGTTSPRNPEPAPASPGSTGPDAPQPAQPSTTTLPSTPSPEPAPAPLAPSRPEEKSPAWELADDARRLIKAMRYTEAEEILARCLDKDPNYGECRMLYASVLASLGHKDRAREQYNHFIRTKPTEQPYRRQHTPLPDYGRQGDEER